jgi:hypothetical protein
MTGQVKEEILARWGELGVEVEQGCLRFAPRLLSRREFFAGPRRFTFVDVDGREQTWELPAESLAFTYCQAPVCYRLADAPGIRIERSNGQVDQRPGNALDAADSASVFARRGEIRGLWISVPRGDLRP